MEKILDLSNTANNSNGFNLNESFGWVGKNYLASPAKINQNGCSCAACSNPVTQIKNPSTMLSEVVDNSQDNTFNIEINFSNGGLTESQKAIFEQAANRWEQIITADLADVEDANLGFVDDLIIDASAINIDGEFGVLGQAGPLLLRSNGLPYFGIMEFDSADLARLEEDGLLETTILHEMGHVLGIGTLWDEFNLLDLSDPNNPEYTGVNAVAQYNAVFDVNETAIAVESGGGLGTALGHWSESVFDNELMTGFLNSGTNSLSAFTIGSLADLGYQVSYTTSDSFGPNGSVGIEINEGDLPPNDGFGVNLFGSLAADTFTVANEEYLGSGFAIVNDFNFADGDKIGLSLAADAYTYDASEDLAGSAALDTQIFLDGDLIAVVADRTGNDFIAALDTFILSAAAPLPPVSSDATDLFGTLGADTFIVVNEEYLGSGFAIVNDFNFAEGDKIALSLAADAYTYDLAEDITGSAALDTQIFLDGDLIAVVADRTNYNFIPGLDTVVI